MRVLTCLLLISLSLTREGVTAQPEETTTLEVGSPSLEFVLAETSRRNFVFYFNRTEGLSPALRLVVSSENATTAHPLLIAARQNQGISSWTLPYIENGFSFSSVERTLCPLLNSDPDHPVDLFEVTVEISTSSPTPVQCTLSSSFVKNFYHQLDSVGSITASPSSPAYLLFEHPEEHSRVRVQFSSMDNTSDVCAIASIQKTYCPVVELLDNPDHRGTFQTMRSQAAINVELVLVDAEVETVIDRQQTEFSFFYIVVSVFPSNDSCLTAGVPTTGRLVTLDLVNNFDPVRFNETNLTKNFNITIQPALPGSSYVLAILLPAFIYFLFYFIALGWILFADWYRHGDHPLGKLIEERLYGLEAGADVEGGVEGGGEEEGGEGTLQEPDPEAGLTHAGLQMARQLSKMGKGDPELSLPPDTSQHVTPETSCHVEEPTPADAQRASSSPAPHSPPHQQTTHPAHHSSPTHLLNTDPASRDQVDHGKSFKKSFSYLTRSHRDRTGDSAHMSKKPSILSVVFGSQYNNSINQVAIPSPHYPQYLHSSQASSPNSQRPAYHRHKSSSESHAGSGHASYARGSGSIATPTSPPRVGHSHSVGSPYKSTTSFRPPLNPSISLTSPVVDQVSFQSRGGARMRGRVSSAGGRRPQGIDSPDTIEEGRAMMVLRERPQDLLRTPSYANALEESETKFEMMEGGVGLAGDGAGFGGEGIGDLAHPMTEGEGGGYCHDKDPFPVNLLMSELPEFDETAHVQRPYYLLSWYIVAIIIFYAIPAYQLVATGQQLLTMSGNNDICYYNSLCSHSWRTSRFTLTAFNNLCSNIGYFVLGFLFILIAYRRRRVYVAVEVVNTPFITNRRNRVGVPQHFGIYYAIGFTLIGEGFMSVAYHICPGKANYQFDTTFMFVLAGLGIFKLLESRSPDRLPSFHKLLVMLALIIVMVVVGVLSSSLAFYVIFSLIHVTVTFFVTVEYYYRWQVSVVSLKCIQSLREYITAKPHWPPKQLPKFVLTIFSNFVNWCFAIYALASQPADFGTYFLSLLLSNFILLLVYYGVTKCLYKERLPLRAVFFLVLSVIFWICGIFFYMESVTNWLESPAFSRDRNSECVAVFYDAHDFWHFTSAFALFFSFLMLMTLDDNTEGTPRSELRVF